jgi:ribonuclease BN (tRNA processing enzyme)
VVDLVVVGAGPAFSDRPGAVGACYLVSHAGSTIALDLGHGAFAGVAGRIAPERLAAVVISHLHPDHFVDLVPLRHYLRYHVVPPARGLVLAPPGLVVRLDGLHAQDGWTSVSLDVEDVREGVVRVGPFEIEARRVTHTADSHAFRVSTAGGAALVYSGDVGVAEDLLPLVHEGDTLLVEVSFGEGPSDPGAGHLDAAAVGELVAATRPGRVLLTHLLMGHDREATVAAVRRRYDGPTWLVEPGDELAIE